MTADLIPQDSLTRKLLARVLAQLIKDDFLKQRAGGFGCEPRTTSADVEADSRNRLQPHDTQAGILAQVGGE